MFLVMLSASTKAPFLITSLSSLSLLSAFQHLLLHTIGGDQSKDQHGLRLANSVAPVHGLQILLGVPIGIVNDHGISGCQVDAEAAGSGAEQEVLVARVPVEAI